MLAQAWVRGVRSIRILMDVVIVALTSRCRAAIDHPIVHLTLVSLRPQTFGHRKNEDRVEG